MAANSPAKRKRFKGMTFSPVTVSLDFGMYPVDRRLRSWLVDKIHTHSGYTSILTKTGYRIDIWQFEKVMRSVGFRVVGTSLSFCAWLIKIVGQYFGHYDYIVETMEPVKWLGAAKTHIRQWLPHGDSSLCQRQELLLVRKSICRAIRK